MKIKKWSKVGFSTKEMKVGNGIGDNRMEFYSSDIIMVILDGCILCGKGKFNAKLTLKYHWPSGSFFTKCWAETKKLDQLYAIRGKLGEFIFQFRSSIQIDGSNNNSFTMPAVFYHRKCMGFFSEDSAPTKYEQIKLEVEHTLVHIPPFPPIE